MEGTSIGMMDAKLAAKIMYADADAATIGEKAAEYASLQESISPQHEDVEIPSFSPKEHRKYANRCI